MNRTCLRTATAAVLALIAGLLALAPGLALAFDGHNAQGQPCWATRGTISGVFHAAELGCTADASAPAKAAPPAPTATPRPAPTATRALPTATPSQSSSQAVPPYTAPISAVYVAPTVAPHVAPTLAPDVAPTITEDVAATVAPASASDVPPDQSSGPPTAPAHADSSTSGSPQLSVSMVRSFAGQVEYTANGSGLPESVIGHFNALKLVLVDADGNLVDTRSPLVSGDGSFTYEIGIGLPGGDYGLAAVDATTGTLLASTAFSAVDDESTVSTTDTPASGASTGYLPPWQTCTGLGAACPALNPFGPFTTP
jgi:hypothetical protein